MGLAEVGADSMAVAAAKKMVIQVGAVVDPATAVLFVVDRLFMLQQVAAMMDLRLYFLHHSLAHSPVDSPAHSHHHNRLHSQPRSP